jgi:hypothetical protein
MARRRKPINFEAIKSGDKTEILRACEDLLRKYPTGPNGNLKKEDYNPHYWKGAVLADGKRTGLGLLDDEQWGYTAAQVWTIFSAMGITGESAGEWDLRRVLYDYYTCSGAGYTRKSRRLNQRYGVLYGREFKSGRLGDMIFDVEMVIKRKEGEGTLRGGKVAIVARNETEANQVAKVMFAHISEPRWASFVKVGGVEFLTGRNSEFCENINNDIQRQKEIVELAQAKIALLQTQIEAVELYNLGAFAE